MASTSIGKSDGLELNVTSVGRLPALAHNVVLLKKGPAPKAFIDKASKATEETGSIPPAMTDQAIVASALVKPGESAEVTFEATATEFRPHTAYWRESMGEGMSPFASRISGGVS